MDTPKASNAQDIKGAIAEEVWNVMYDAIAIANLYDIDLEQVIRVKSEMNQSRYPSDIVFEENR